MIHMTRILTFASLALITACSGGGDTASGQSQVIVETIKAGNFGKRKAQPTPAPVITRALLNTITIGSLEARLENTGSTAYMIPVATRVNSGPGKITVWKTGLSGENVIMRNGVLVGTKGLSNDLSSADGSVTVRALKSRKSMTGGKTYYFRLDDNSTQQIRLQCDIQNLGNQSIEIVGKLFATTHMREVCSNETGRITNDYWVDSRDSTVWKSRQWGGPNLGYLGFRRLKK